MPLSPEHQARVQQWLQLRAPRLSCQGCGGPMGPAASLVQLNQVEADGSVSLGDGEALVQLACGVCGCTVLFAAEPMGIEFEDADEDEEDGQEGDDAVESLFR